MKTKNIQQLLGLILFSLCSLTLTGQNATLSGKIMKADSSGLTNVTVKLYDQTGNLVDQMMTGPSGNYVFSDLTTGQLYLVSPERPDDVSNGVSVLDMMLLSQHILMNGMLTTPAQVLAADMNNSGGMTTFDLILIAKGILDIPGLPDFAGEWRFFRSDLAFTDPGNPFNGITSSSNELLLEESTIHFDFIGIKPGDIDGSAN